MVKSSTHIVIATITSINQYELYYDYYYYHQLTSSLVLPAIATVRSSDVISLRREFILSKRVVTAKC